MRGMLAPKESQGGRARVLAYRNFCSNRPTTLTTQVALKQSSQTDHYYAPLRAGMRLPIITLIPLYSSPATQLRGQDSLGQKSQQSQTQSFFHVPSPSVADSSSVLHLGEPTQQLEDLRTFLNVLEDDRKVVPLTIFGQEVAKTAALNA
tara:strand:- start:435 stop:881 length:447 start_codon:yes stop_codon:yes gene_type:complete